MQLLPIPAVGTSINLNAIKKEFVSFEKCMSRWSDYVTSIGIQDEDDTYYHELKMVKYNEQLRYRFAILCAKHHKSYNMALKSGNTKDTEAYGQNNDKLVNIQSSLSVSRLLFPECFLCGVFANCVV